MADDLDIIEMRNTLAQLASLLRHFYLALLDEGFTEAQALELTKSKAGD